MCSKVTCKKCGKPTWSGCGEHIEEALQGIPKNQRCACGKSAQSKSSGANFFTRLLGGK
jgi:hypothetical protein